MGTHMRACMFKYSLLQQCALCNVNYACSCEESRSFEVYEVHIWYDKMYVVEGPLLMRLNQQVVVIKLM